jgi:hypothetical protein
MAITVGTSEPTSFTIGDTVSWSRHEADYIAPTWNLVWGFSGPTRFTVTSTDYNTTDHLGTMPTTGLKPGKYTWTVKATDGTSNITLGSGETDALPNLSAADTELDAAEAQLTVVETAYNALATGKNVSVSVDGVTYTRRQMSELKGAMLYARREVERLRNVRRALLGQATGRLFLTKFVN